MLALTCAAVRRDASQTSTAWADLSRLLFSCTPRTSEPSLPCTRKQLFNICSPKLFNQSIRAKSDSKTLHSALVIFAASAAKFFESKTSAAHWRRHFRGIGAISLLHYSLEKEAFYLVHMNYSPFVSVISLHAMHPVWSRSLKNRIISRLVLWKTESSLCLVSVCLTATYTLTLGGRLFFNVLTYAGFCVVKICVYVMSFWSLSS